MAKIDVEDILSKLNGNEKLTLLAGRDYWHTHAIPRLGLPSLRTSDGPNGVRGTSNFNGKRSACFPCGTGLAATWNMELLEEAGALMGEEAKAKGAHVLLGPCINMQRSPLGGRGFESLSEDPVLAGLGAGALINGMQSTGVQATIKHFVCNDQEHERSAYSAEVTERALREIYLSPFQIAIRDSKPTCLMTAYNKVNGEHVSESKRLLNDVLRNEWGWKGLVMSDWYGTYSSPNPVSAGMALEMPGPARYHNTEILNLAIAANRLSQFTVDERVREYLTLVNQCAASGVAENAPEVERNTPETSAFLRKAATEAIVLLKNDGRVLPLNKEKTVAIIGPNAKAATIFGGGSSSLPPYYAVTPFDGISAKVKFNAVSYTIGSHAHKELPLLGSQLKTVSGAIGVTFKAYNEPPSTPNREVADEIVLTNTNMLLSDYRCPRIPNDLWYADVEGIFVPDESAEYEFGICVYGTARLFVDGKMVIDNETTQFQGTVFYGCGTREERTSVWMEKGKSYHLKVEFASAPTCKLGDGGIVRSGGGGLRIGGTRKIDPDAEISRAVEIAKAASGGHLCWPKCEGADRANMDLPGRMNDLILAVLKANPKAVVVMQSGTPVEMPWIQSAPALVQAWYGGNEAGNAIADILFGDANPSGKLPLSFPVRVQDNPAYLNYRSNRGRTLYGEDVFIGYRFYEASSRRVLFPFGHGLSYTTFSMKNLQVLQSRTELSVSLDITNTGDIAGSEVTQLYIAQDSPSVSRPPKELKGFTRTTLQPGQTKTVKITAPMKYATSFWDEGRDMWICERDLYHVIVANSSSPDGAQILRGEFKISKTSWWKGL